VNRILLIGKLILIGCGCFALVATGVLAIHLDTAVSSGATGLGGLVTKANTTLDAINRPCGEKINGSLQPCGMLASVNKSVTYLGDLTVTTQRQVDQSQALVTHSTALIDGMSGDIHTAVASLQTTSMALSGTANQATVDLQTANATIAGAQPLLSHLDEVSVSANGSVLKFNALLDNPAIPSLLTSSESITASGAHIMQTTDAVETKLTQCTLHPTFACNVRRYTLLGAQAGGYLLQALPK
jgi:hypothetical protein